MRSMMHTISLRSMTLLAALEVGLLSAQNTVPTFDQYRVTQPKFSGKPMLPVIKTAEDRRFRTRIREAAADGPNFAGRARLITSGADKEYQEEQFAVHTKEA